MCILPFLLRLIVPSIAFSTRIGCCWWGRGIFRHINHGRCFFGRLNDAIGKGAAMDGRPSLYPDTDFCANPEAVCSSEDSDELQWVVGMFHWIKAVQSYNKDGWSFMDKLREVPLDDVTDSRFNEMLIAVDCIMKTGSHRCDIGIDSTELLLEILAVFDDKYEQNVINAPSASPTLSTMPSASPTVVPTGKYPIDSVITFCLASILCALILALWCTYYSHADAVTNGLSYIFLCTECLAEHF